MPFYIVTLEAKEQFDFKGNSLGMSENLALFYLPSIGRQRCYRDSIANPKRGLKLLTFKREKSALKVCDKIVSLTTDKWKVETF